MSLKERINMRIVEDDDNSLFFLLCETLGGGKNTAGVARVVFKIKLDKNEFTLDIWNKPEDTFFSRGCTSQLFPKYGPVILCYDTTRRETFENATRWLEEFKKYSYNTKIPIILTPGRDPGKKGSCLIFNHYKN